VLRILAEAAKGGTTHGIVPLDEMPRAALYFAQHSEQRQSNEEESPGLSRRTSRHPELMRE
jgi:hypothetical protein